MYMIHAFNLNINYARKVTLSLLPVERLGLS